MIVGVSWLSVTLFRLAMAVLYLAVAWLCIEAVRIPDLRDLIRQGYQTTMRITAMVIFILIGSTCFSVVFLGVYGGRWLEHMLTSLPGGVWGFLRSSTCSSSSWRSSSTSSRSPSSSCR